jgi:hypothetical protein
MKFLVSLILCTLVSITSISATEQKTAWEDFDAIGELAFKPLKIDTYTDDPSEASEIAYGVSKILVGVGVPAGYLATSIIRKDFHKKLVKKRAILSKTNGAILNNAEIDKILFEVERLKPRAQKKVLIVFQDKQNMKPVMVREITKENIEHALSNLSNNNVKAYSVSLGKVKTSKLKVGGHVLAIYLALDLAHTIRN